MDYRVELDVFNGPLDLLLYLIKRDELDIYDIPIARIAASFMHYVAHLQTLTGVTGGGKAGSRPPEEKELNSRTQADARPGTLDINSVGDFLVMAATLMEIKSAMLLPAARPADEHDKSAHAELTDPRYELVQQLLEYKRLKDNAALLEQHRWTHEGRFARAAARWQADEPPPLAMDEVQVWDLLAAFSRLMAEVGQRRPTEHEVVYDDTPLDLHAADIEDRLKRDGRSSLRQLLAGRASRSEMIGLFLALLELVRQKRVLTTQTEDAGELLIETAPPEHQLTFTRHLTDAGKESADDEPTR